MARKFHVLIEKDEDGGFVGKVLELKGCLSQGDTVDELMDNIKEAIELCLEAETEEMPEDANFVGVREVEV
jgi:predicted RNase H-like HicB family nuclease